MGEYTIKKIKLEPNLDIVEETTLRFLKAGYTISDISKLLGLNLAPVVAELAYKGILNSDATFRNTPPKEKYHYEREI
ncbi:MAG: hypothetical protein FWC91_10720 [Defluviitaleaceae bacterium]|nr:hypothetical protein [Defluviitaleaceae bacterium]